MANREHLQVIKGGSKNWNEWRARYSVIPDLVEADLRDADLAGANLRDCNISRAIFTKADLSRAVLNGVIAYRTEFQNAILRGADVGRALLSGANLQYADLSHAQLCRSVLIGANLTGSNVNAADFKSAVFESTIFAKIDLSKALNLDCCWHEGPSTIGIDTIYLSRACIPIVFLRDAGVPDDLIANLPLLSKSAKAAQFYSCFISYSHKDEGFAKRLFSGLREHHLRVWFAPEDMQGGRKLIEQISDAIRNHDKVLLVLSEASIASEWVVTEIRSARVRECREKRRVLFPIRLIDMDMLRKWSCFDSDTGQDLAVIVREYFIPDFSNWENPFSFQQALEKLIGDLRSSA